MSPLSFLTCALLAHGLAAAAAKHARVDVRLEASPGGMAAASDAARRIESGAGFLAVAAPPREAAELSRETQAPMVWLNLHKSTAGVAGAGFVSLAEPAVDAVASIFEHAPVQTFEAPKEVAATSALVRDLAAQPAPPSPIASRVLDPARHHAIAACDRDLAQPCPAEFEPVGNGQCAPLASYAGPCGGAHSFAGLSPTAKARWSELCLAWWPCVSCERDLAGVCPVGWVRGGGAVCEPTPGYAGPCAASVDFAGYTRSMMAEWSATCDAHWPCAAAAASFLGTAGDEVVEVAVPAARPVDVSAPSAAASASLTMKLVPPAEDAADTVARLDDLMAAERAKQAAANARFAAEKQRALDADRLELRAAMRKSAR